MARPHHASAVGTDRPPVAGPAEGPPAWSADARPRRDVAGTALLGKACDILDSVGRAPSGIDHAELARLTGMPRATLYRITGALQARGLIRHDPALQTYSLGFGFLELAQNVWASNDLATVAATELRRLRDMTGETTYLAVPHADAVLAIGRFDGAHPHRSAARLGVLKPLHCTSQGKAILAQLPDALADRLLARPLERFTARTLTDAALVKAQLGIVRMRGYAIDDEEILDGTRCAGAAILDPAGRPVAAISVAGPGFRITPDRAEQLGVELAAAARRIAGQIGRAAPSVAPVGTAAVPVAERPDFAGSGVLWDARAGAPVWLDRLAPAVHRGDATVSLEALGSEIDCAFLTDRGLAVLARGRILRLGGDGTITQRPLPDDIRITAVRVAPDGTVWAAAHDAASDRSTIGPLTPDGIAVAVFSLAGRVDALACDATGATLYAAVPGPGLILCLTPADRRKRLFCRFPKAAGAPAGLAVDAESRIWVAADGGWSVVRLSEDGEFDRIVSVPVPSPTSLAFGGPGLGRLYVTSARVGLSLDALANAPHAGRLLAIDATVRGLPEAVAHFEEGTRS